MKYYLLVDLGTGNTRVSLVSQKGEILGIRTFTNTYYRDSAYSDAQYFLPSEWGERIIRCCEELHAEFPDVEIRSTAEHRTYRRQRRGVLRSAEHR